MKRYSFAGFQVSERNKPAREICRAIGDFAFEGLYPVVLVGGSGSGKTHLLYSIANHIRRRRSKAVLAVITAGKFPPEVRALADDEEPLRRVHHAVLLVDQLEQFSQHTDDLEAVVRRFLTHGYAVVLASARPPEQLTHLSPSFRETLLHGSIVTLWPRDTKPSGGGPGELNERIVAMESSAVAAQEHIIELERQVDSLRIRLDDEQRSNRALEGAIDQKKTENAALQQELSEARGMMETQAATISALEEKALALERELDETRREQEAVIARIRAMAEQVESYSALSVEGERAQQAQLDELEAALSVAFSNASPPQEVERLKQELDEAHAAFQAIREQLRVEHAAAAQKVAALEATNQDLDARMTDLRRRFDAQTAEIEALRHEAAAQVAAAHAQAGEIERKLAHLTAVHEMGQAAAGIAAADITAVRDRLVAAAEALGAAAAQLSRASDAALAENDKPDNLAILDRADSRAHEEADRAGRAASGV